VDITVLDYDATFKRWNWRRYTVKLEKWWLVGGFSLLLVAAPILAQTNRWDGADDLPVAPLACPGETAPEAEDSVPYDGGQPAGAPDLAGQPIVLVDVPRLVGSDYYDVTARGARQAAQELGNVMLTTDAPVRASVDDQVAFIENYLGRRVQGVLVAANDREAVADVLRDTLDEGIHVVGYDADVEPDAREWFVNPAPYNAVAKALIDTVVNQAGENARFGLLTGTFATPNQARWIAEMWAYAEACHPGLQWVETVEVQEDDIVAFNQATTLLTKYGADLDALISVSTVGTPNVAEALTQAGLCGSKVITGLALPSDLQPYVNDGCVQSVVLWNPLELGYASVYALRAAVDGVLTPGSQSVTLGRLGEREIVNGSEIVLGPPLILNARNINNFDF
jgi:rhamnose transport system substrate-binding protein